MELLFWISCSNFTINGEFGNEATLRSSHCCVKSRARVTYWWWEAVCLSVATYFFKNYVFPWKDASEASGECSEQFTVHMDRKMIKPRYAFIPKSPKELFLFFWDVPNVSKNIFGLRTIFFFSSIYLTQC